ncbi:NUD14 pyrophosphatase, partial [Probosciger aterrimus]|nr:NUD14 pyrophosphatase [Probosciger aterrimus]
QNGTKKVWDFMKIHDSVSILIFNTSRQCFVLVKQFRPGLGANNEKDKHIMRNLNARGQRNRILKNKKYLFLLKKNVIQKVNLNASDSFCCVDRGSISLKKNDLYCLQPVWSGVGVTGSSQTLFYAEVTDQMRIGEGGGQAEEGELIEVVEIPLEDSMKFAYDETLQKTMGVIFSFTWFQDNIAPKLLK